MRRLPLALLLLLAAAAPAQAADDHIDAQDRNGPLTVAHNADGSWSLSSSGITKKLTAAEAKAFADQVKPDPPPDPQCQDGKDNDGDGKIDLLDVDCFGPADDDESAPPPPPPLPSCSKLTVWVNGTADGTTSSGVAKYLYVPPADSQVCVTQTADQTSRGNQTPNAYVPADSQIQAARSALDRNGQTMVQSAWYPQYVTGRHSLGAAPSTDDLIEFYSHKWGIPEDWLRAQYTKESDWRQSAKGDLRTESAAWWSWYNGWGAGYCPNSTQCYESVGITQVKAHPPGTSCVSACGAEPLRRLSTAWNVDYAASMARFMYDNPKGLRSGWGDASYHPLDGWGSVCAWFSSYPFNNSSAAVYCDDVKARLASRVWEGYG